MKKYYFNQNGFTLMEALVAISVFAILAVAVSAIFVNVNAFHQRTLNFEQLQNEGRYLMEKMAREIRGRELIMPEPPNHLLRSLDFKVDEYGESVSIYFVQADRGQGSFGNLIYEATALGQSAKQDFLNAEAVAVQEVKFFVSPATEDRWGQEPTANFQPRVTILLKLKNNAANPKYQEELIFQTTISSHIYKR